MEITDKELEATKEQWWRQDRHAVSIGRLGMTWAALDRIVDSLFAPFL